MLECTQDSAKAEQKAVLYRVIRKTSFKKDKETDTHFTMLNFTV